MLTLTQIGCGGGGGGAWREVGEEEGERRRRSLCLEETLRAPVPRPFKNPSVAVLWHGGALQTTITGKDGDDPQPVNRVTQPCGTRCHLWYVDLVCARSNPEESQPKKNQM